MYSFASTCVGRKIGHRNVHMRCTRFLLLPHVHVNHFFATNTRSCQSHNLQRTARKIMAPRTDHCTLIRSGRDATGAAWVDQKSTPRRMQSYKRQAICMYKHAKVRGSALAAMQGARHAPLYVQLHWRIHRVWKAPA